MKTSEPIQPATNTLRRLVRAAGVAGHEHVDGGSAQVDRQVGDRVAEEVDEVLRDQGVEADACWS